MNFEDELRKALERRDPPAGFAERAVALAARPSRRRAVWRWGAWAAAAALVAGSGLEYYRFREARLARERTMLALRIAGKHVAAAQKRLERVNVLRTLVEDR